MKIICVQDELSRFLQIAARAIATKSTLPILTGILLETKNDYLRCVATDLEIAIEVKVPNVQIITPGTLVLPGKTFVDIIRHLPPAPVEIEFDEKAKVVSINSKHSSYQLPILPLEEFPSLPELKDSEKIEINADNLKEAIRQTIYATLAEDPRPFLSSILWECSAEQMRLVATDVNRLAIRDITVKNSLNKTALVPVRSLREIANIFGGHNEEILNISIEDKLIFVNGAGVTFSSRLVEAQFPRYEQVIPKEFQGSLIVKRNDLIDALERSALVSHSIKINISNEKMVITAKEPDRGKSYEEITVEVEGSDLEIGFNVRFLLDYLKSVDEDEIIINYNQEQKPVLMKVKGNENYLYIVMPLKLSV